MRSSILSARPQAANTLVTVLAIGGVVSISLAAMLSLSNTSLRNSHGRADWNAAFYHAENALQWAAQKIADASPASTSNYYSTANGTLAVSYMTAAATNSNSAFKGAWVSIVNTNAALPNIYLVTASARVNDKVQTLQSVVTKNPPSQIFDYEYFLNNWGWWWGASIAGNGGNRANWDFDFRGGPTVNGVIMANGQITENGVPFNQITDGPPFGGTAGSDPVEMVHSGVPRVPMPNLLDFSHYTSKALGNVTANTLWVGTNQVVMGVQTSATQPGLYVAGSAAQPIIVSNTVVIPGDLVIQGPITGQGTIYVGGNLYIAGDLTYKNGPDWSTPPETLPPDQRDSWVANNLSFDLVGFAVRGCILAGDVTNPDWIGHCYDPAGYGLANVGDESHLGADGIAGTPDDNIPFLHPDGTWSCWYDADGDGIMEGNYDYASQINMDTTRASKILGYPVDNNKAPLPYNQLATDNMGNLDGIFYTDHAAAMRLANGTSIFHGVIVSRNECIIFQNNIIFDYDSRVNSRYNGNPNRYIDLGLPVGNVLKMTHFAQITPNPSNL